MLITLLYEWLINDLINHLIKISFSLRGSIFQIVKIRCKEFYLYAKWMRYLLCRILSPEIPLTIAVKSLLGIYDCTPLCNLSWGHCRSPEAGRSWITFPEVQEAATGAGVRGWGWACSSSGWLTIWFYLVCARIPFTHSLLDTTLSLLWAQRFYPDFSLRTVPCP